RADASTLSVVNAVKASLGQFQSVVPEDIKIDYEFDQSSYVRSSLLSVVKEGLLGAVLTGVMVLLFLRDWRSAFIVVTTIPFALLSLAVGFARAASYLLVSSLVPVLSTWILREHAPEAEDAPSMLHRVSKTLGRILNRLTAIRGLTISAYVLASILVVVLLGPYLGREIFPRVSSGQLLLRFRAPIGTRVETTERLTLTVLRSIQQAAGPGNVRAT